MNMRPQRDLFRLGKRWKGNKELEKYGQQQRPASPFGRRVKVFFQHKASSDWLIRLKGRDTPLLGWALGAVFVFFLTSITPMNKKAARPEWFRTGGFTL